MHKTDFYDLYVPVEENTEEVARTAGRMGFSGIGITHTYEGKEGLNTYLEKMDEVDEKVEIDIIRSCALSPDNPKTLKRQLGKVRQKVEVVIVEGGDFDINRATTEESRVDILAHPEYKRKDPGMDHKTSKMAAENDVSVGLVFHNLHQTYGKVRSHVLRHMKRCMQLCEKYDTKLILLSGARDRYGLRDPRELASLGKILGRESSEVLQSVSSIPKKIVETNRKKLMGEIKGGGVEEL
ncbi:MAG: RNase P subunit p30 family protein [Candidatus Aenigmatarchaeota archaeon]